MARPVLPSTPGENAATGRSATSSPGVRVFAQMACDEHAVRGFGAKGIRGDGPVAHSGYQDKPLLGQKRAQLAGNGPYISLVAVVDGGELGHIQRDVPSFGAAQAAALNLHPASGRCPTRWP